MTPMPAMRKSPVGPLRLSTHPGTGSFKFLLSIFHHYYHWGYPPTLTLALVVFIFCIKVFYSFVRVSLIQTKQYLPRRDNDAWSDDTNGQSMTFVLHKLLCHCLQKIDHENGPLCQKASLPLWMCRCLDDLQESSLSHRGCPVLKEEASLEGREPYREENVLTNFWAIIPTFLGELELDRPPHLCGPWDIQLSIGVILSSSVSWENVLQLWDVDLLQLAYAVDTWTRAFKSCIPRARSSREATAPT